ncbi:MAG: hypothetical protein ACR2KL_05830 [Nocardioidaceae bacterium]
MLDFPLAVQVFADDPTELEFETREANVVVLTQSCDIPKGAQHSLIVAEVYEYGFLVRAGKSHLKTDEYKRGLARGTAVCDFLMPPSEHFGWSIVGFRDVHVVPKQLVLKQYGEAPSLRLTSPYKEYLSQAFARFIMRVGLGQTLAEFERA